MIQVGLIAALCLAVAGLSYGARVWIESSVAGASQGPQRILEEPRKVQAEPPKAVEMVEAPDIFADKKLLKSFVQDQNYKVFPALADIIIDAVFVASGKYDIPPVVLFALVKVESDFDYTSVSKTGAIGLTQISAVWLDPQNEKSLIKHGVIKTKRDLYNPLSSIMAGGYILRHYVDEGIRKKESNPIRYGVTRYLGGYKNDHYNNLITSIGEYYVHTLLSTGTKEETKKGGKEQS
jgi:soluble lytic murein transglycosylase-like protein